MNILSIDIGIHNLGYSLYLSSNDYLFFDIYNVDEKITNKDKKNSGQVLSRTKYLKVFVDSIFSKYNDINIVIIERQVNINTQAMELMYLLTGLIYSYCENIIIFDPKLKFKTLSINFDTKNKHHKKLSIEIMKSFISRKYPILLTRFDNFEKKDDIADSLFMLLIILYKDNKEMLNFIRNYNGVDIKISDDENL